MRVVVLDEPAVGDEILVDGEVGRIDEIRPDGSWVVTLPAPRAQQKETACRPS